VSDTRVSVADIAFVLLTLAFFAACVLYVRACDRLIAPTEEELERDREREELAA
jgi:hypothetical protein